MRQSTIWSVLLLGLFWGLQCPGMAPGRPLPPLTVHDVGEYAAVPWEDVKEPIEPGSRAERVRDLNFAVSSINLSGFEGEIPKEFLERWAKAAALGAAQGKKFLPRLYFWDGNDRFEGPLRDIEVYWRRLDQFLGAMNLEHFYGIVLAEENVPYGGRPEVLRELYHRIKAKYDVAVWQWWTPMDPVPSDGGWIPADGWIIDLYLMPKEQFRRHVRKYLITGLPLVIMPWASTMWGELSEEQWQANRDQLEVAVEFNLPVAFFWVHKETCYFGGRRDAHETLLDKVNHFVWSYIERVKKIPRDYTGLPSADWGEGRILELGPVVGERFVYRDDFSREKCVDDAWMKGFRDLILDGKTLRARGFLGRKTKAELLYRFAGDFSVQYPRARVEAILQPQLQGRVELALSPDGRDWPVAAATKGKSQLLELSSAGNPKFASCRELWLRVRLTGEAGDKENPPCQIDNLELSGRIVPPKDNLVYLRPGPAGELVYEDNFATRKYVYTTTRTGDDKLEWQEGHLAVRLQPGGAAPALIWHVKAPRAVQEIKIQAVGRANPVYLATHLYLAVSPDGKSWTEEVSTQGMKTNVSGWTSNPLVIHLSGRPEYSGAREFYVRIRLVAAAHHERHPALSGYLDSLHISAR